MSHASRSRGSQPPDLPDDSAALPAFTLGAKVAASLVWASGHTFSGTLGILKKSHKGGARGAYTIEIEGPFDGAVTRA